MPKSNAQFWQAKFNANLARDIRVVQQLRQAGWRTGIVWECSLGREMKAELVDEIAAFIRESTELHQVWPISPTHACRLAKLGLDQAERPSSEEVQRKEKLKIKWAQLEALSRRLSCPQYPQERMMDKDRMKGAGKETKGAMKDMAGKATGNKQTQAEGKADKAEGKTQSTFGKAKDKARDATR